MKQTEYKFDGKLVSYDILNDGYKIYLDGTEWIQQEEPLIPYPNLSYEEGCLKQIEELCNPVMIESVESEQNAKILKSNEAITEQLNRIEETIASTALTTEYMACIQELNSETVK